MKIKHFRISLIVALISSTVFLSLSEDVDAKRLLPRVAAARHSVPAASTARRAPSANTRGVTTSVKFRSDRHAVIVNFSNLDIASLVSYSLTYQTNGKEEGVVGELDPAVSAATETREVLFGTCSAGVCRYHSNITGARLNITTTLPSGLKIVKPYRLKP